MKKTNDNDAFSFNGKKYELTFSDEFESAKPNTKKWSYCPEQARQDAGGWWSNECSTFENGNYVITCKLKDGYKLYMDGTDEKHLIYDMPGKDYGEGTCQVPCYLKITSEFGTWAGSIVPEQLPKHFYVDYVRVYKEK